MDRIAERLRITCSHRLVQLFQDGLSIGNEGIDDVVTEGGPAELLEAPQGLAINRRRQ